jgi:hypothetical protein
MEDDEEKEPINPKGKRKGKKPHKSEDKSKERSESFQKREIFKES